MRAGDLRVGMKVADPVNGTYVISRYQWHAGLGVMTFDQDGQEAAFYPFHHEIEVIS